MAYLRKVRKEDMDLLFEWANDPVVRKNAFQTEKIPYENHKKWFADRLQDPETAMYLLLREDDEPIGQVRITIEDGTGLIDYSIKASERGKGYGRRMLALLEEKLVTDYPKVKTLVAQVKKENAASKSAFLHANFEEYFTEYHKEVGKEGLV